MTAQTLSIIDIALTAAGSYMFFSTRVLRYLRYFQQEDYLSSRFCNWYLSHKAFDRTGSGIAFLVGAVSLMLSRGGVLLASILGALTLIIIAFREEDPRVSGKITLKITRRVRRIVILASLLYIVAIFTVAANCYVWFPAKPASSFWFAQIVLFQLHPAFIILSNWLLGPYEDKIQAGFARLAVAKIKELHPYVIGITGSFGKTSTKGILGQILNNVSPTFYPRGSINTYMGITRDIRENLKPEHRFAVIEMAAYRRGTISQLCELAAPQAAIVTAVGEMHMERFGSIEQVYLAKSELAQAVASDGILVVNGDNQLCRKMAQQNPKKLNLVYGMDESQGALDAYLYDIEVLEDGRSRFKIRWRGAHYQGYTNLLGKHMLSNVLAAFTMSCALNCDPEFVLAAIRNIKPEPNRLEPVQVPISTFAPNNGLWKSGRVLRLNDAFNSNPQGFAAALEVLKTIPAAGRKVLVTPGMIELGPQQVSENRKAAITAARICDLVAVVGRTNKRALLDGLREAKVEDDKYRLFDSMKEALGFLGAEYLINGDVVLIENDLTDLYEGAARF